MWKFIKQWFSRRDKNLHTNTPQDAPQPDYQWHEADENNPFGVRLLDVRGLTWNVTATTQSKEIAELFNAQRQTAGREYLDAVIAEAQTITCDLALPHNGEPLEGVVSKADSMEVKWDIYIYDSTFLFVRSWTGDLQYRAQAIVDNESIRITQVETSANQIDLAVQTVYFLLASHAMRRVHPHPIPSDFSNDDHEGIALWSFANFGNLACYATPEDVTQIAIKVENP